MTIPYTYVVTCPNGQRYYGVRYAKGCHPSDLWTLYFTSSKHVKRMLAEHGAEKFSYAVRKVFSSSAAARSWEERVLRRLHIHHNPRWINGNNCRFPILLGDANPSKRADVRQKISASKVGKARPDQAERMRQNHPMHNPETLAKMVATRKSKLASGEIEIWCKGKKRDDISGKKHHRFGKAYAPLADMNRVQYTCPWCAKVGKGPSMKRYHFNNCKSKNADG